MRPTLTFRSPSSPGLRPGLVGVLALLATPGLRPGSVGIPSLRALDPLQDRQGALAPGASPGTMGNLEGRPFGTLGSDPGNPGLAPGVGGFPVLEGADRAVQRVALGRLFPRSANQRNDLIIAEPHRRARTGFVVH